MEALIAEGHTDALRYSLRQIEVYVWLMDRRHKKRDARDLQISLLGARGDKQTIDKKLKEWTK